MTSSRSFRHLLIAIVIVSASHVNHAAAQVVDYNAFGNPNPLTPDSTDPNLTASNFTLGPGFTGNNTLGSNQYGAFYGGAYPATLADAVSGNLYFTFTLTPQSNYSLNATDIDFVSGFYSQNGDRNFVLESNVTGFGSVGSNQLASFPAFTSQDVSLGSAFGALTTPTEFRVYVYGAADGGGYETVALQDGFFVNGSLNPAAAPEPSTYALLCCGIGTMIFVARRRHNKI